MEEKLIELLNNSYANYSNYHVSSIVVTKDNKMFYGVNIENKSYGATICAERVAIDNAIVHGYKKNDFKEIHIMNNSNELGMPCMICRQVFTEFFDENTKIFVYNINKEVKEYSYQQLCPLQF